MWRETPRLPRPDSSGALLAGEHPLANRSAVSRAEQTDESGRGKRGRSRHAPGVT